MNDDVNRSSVIANFWDVKRRMIADEFKITFYNERVRDLSQRFVVKSPGQPITLQGVPAFPVGLAEAFINPSKYRYKSIFINVPAGAAGEIEETFFVDPAKVKPTFPEFAQIRSGNEWSELWRVLQASGIGTEAAWDGLDDLQKAGLFNLYAKMQREVVEGGRPVVQFIDRITKFLSARIFAAVQTPLHDLVSQFSKGFHSVSGALHDLGEGWNLVDSYKTYDSAGNLQLTFGKNDAGAFMADIDIDDHQGIEHAADVLKHTITGKDTHPYDIHEILIYFQHVDPGYQLD